MQFWIGYITGLLIGLYVEDIYNYVMYLKGIIL